MADRRAERTGRLTDTQWDKRTAETKVAQRVRKKDLPSVGVKAGRRAVRSEGKKATTRVLNWAPMTAGRRVGRRAARMG